jgi:hypothetical protein
MKGLNQRLKQVKKAKAKIKGKQASLLLITVVPDLCLKLQVKQSLQVMKPDAVRLKWLLFSVKTFRRI